MELDRNTETAGPRTAPPSRHGRIELLALGTELAQRFEILDVLGTGGYAVVYRARDRALGRDVALKVLRHDRISDSALKRLRREAAIARDVVHPRLVRIFDIEESAEAVFLTMEVVEGGSLGERLSEARLSIDQAVRWAAQALEGLEALHALGILHRDIKPGNLLIDDQGDLKLTDFGLALHLERDETRATTHESVLGTLEYLSPEQALGKEVDARSDLYSLGVVLFEMIAGRLPFEAQSSLGSLLERLQSEDPPDLTEIRPDTPVWLAATVSRLLARRPELRYQSAAAAIADLEGRSARKNRTWNRRWLVASIAVAILAGSSLWSVRQWRTSRYSHLIFEADNSAHALDFAGRSLWVRENVRTAYNFVPLRLPGGTVRLAAFPGSDTDFVSSENSKLELLDPQTGAPDASFALPSLHSLFHGFADRYSPVLDAVDIDGDGCEEIVAGFYHVPYYPFYFALLEPALGRSRLLFAAAGHHRLAGAADLDGDGHRDLLVSGINNRMGWINGVGAIRVDPWIGDTAWRPRQPIQALAPDLEATEMEPNLSIWYTLLPSLQRITTTPKVTIDAARHEIQVPIGGEIFRLDFDGFRLDRPSSLSRPDRMRSRRDAFSAMREGTRLMENERAPDAVVTLDRGRAAAERANEPTIAEWLDRLASRARLRAGLRVEGLERFERLWRTSELASDVAFEAAIELHGQGDVGAAVDWYRRALARGAAQETGRNKSEVVQALVVALAELGRQAEALQAIERFEQIHAGIDLKRERAFLSWYFGGTPDPEEIPVEPAMQDVHLYWRLELLLRAGSPPAALLDQVRSARQTAPESRPLFDGLEAELLSRLGRNAEALPLARQALEQARLGAPKNLLFRAHWKLLDERLRRIEKAATSS